MGAREYVLRIRDTITRQARVSGNSFGRLCLNMVQMVLEMRHYLSDPPFYAYAWCSFRLVEPQFAPVNHSFRAL